MRMVASVRTASSPADLSAVNLQTRGRLNLRELMPALPKFFRPDSIRSAGSCTHRNRSVAVRGPVFLSFEPWHGWATFQLFLFRLDSLWPMNTVMKLFRRESFRPIG